MSVRIITGQQPSWEKKGDTLVVSVEEASHPEFVPRRIAQYRGVPAEATMTIEDEPLAGLRSYHFMWWEITL